MTYPVSSSGPPRVGVGHVSFALRAIPQTCLPPVRQTQISQSANNANNPAISTTKIERANGVAQACSAILSTQTHKSIEFCAQIPHPCLAIVRDAFCAQLAAPTGFDSAIARWFPTARRISHRASSRPLRVPRDSTCVRASTARADAALDVRDRDASSELARRAHIVPNPAQPFGMSSLTTKIALRYRQALR